MFYEWLSGYWSIVRCILFQAKCVASLAMWLLLKKERDKSPNRDSSLSEFLILLANRTKLQKVVF